MQAARSAHGRRVEQHWDLEVFRGLPMEKVSDVRVARAALDARARVVRAVVWVGVAAQDRQDGGLRRQSQQQGNQVLEALPRRPRAVEDSAPCLQRGSRIVVDRVVDEHQVGLPELAHPGVHVVNCGCRRRAPLPQVAHGHRVPHLREELPQALRPACGGLSTLGHGAAQGHDLDRLAQEQLGGYPLQPERRARVPVRRRGVEEARRREREGRGPPVLRVAAGGMDQARHGRTKLRGHLLLAQLAAPRGLCAAPPRKLADPVVQPV
mmetsp:Transcript_15485/g.42260  ORF Transcript_15485/g.42260 Transcript_15485/m.42260 type:complete len:266 (+) Transcript_15485:526-1323(+)